MTNPGTHPLSMHPETKRWGNGGFRRITPKDTRPHAACPQCYGDATSPDTTNLLTFHCPRGHEFLQYRDTANAHTTWLARYTTGLDRNI